MSEAAVLKDYFIFGQLLGKGSFATVFKVTDRHTNKDFAMKIIEKGKSDDCLKQVFKEVFILKKIKHQNVIRLYECYEAKDRIYMQMEYAKGGILFDRIVNLGFYNEDGAKRIARQILEAVEYIHSKGVVHRDLKPENLILSDDRDDALVKLADFGLSTIISNHDTLMKTSCGTLAYAAPEILNGLKYGQCVDFWSIGVIFYNLLSGYPPFFDVDERKMRVKIKEAQYKFYSPDWDDVSNEAKALIRGLIEVDPAKRLTASKALTHKWFDKTEEMKNLAPIVSDNLVKHFNAKRKLKVGANAVHFVVKEMNLHSKKSQKMLENLPQPEQYSAII